MDGEKWQKITKRQNTEIKSKKQSEKNKLNINSPGMAKAKLHNIFLQVSGVFWILFFLSCIGWQKSKYK